jgi:hypothetical protein
MEEVHRSDAFLDAMRQVADPLADSLIAEVFTEGGEKALWRLNRFLQDYRQAEPDEFPGVRAFLAAPVQYPPWFKEPQLELARKLFYESPISTLLALFMCSFPQFLADADAAIVFYRANIFAPRTLLRFMAEIAQLMIDVMKKGGLDTAPLPKGPGVVALQKLRLHHSIVRYQMHYAKPDKPWDPAWGKPINQEDLACALWAFAAFNLDALQKLELELGPAEAESTLMLWKLVGFLLGLRDELQPVDLAAARRLLAEIGRRQFRGEPPNRALIRQLLRAIKSFIPFWLFFLRGIPAHLMRFLMAPEFVVMLRVPRGIGPTWLFVALLRLVFGQVRAFQRLAKWLQPAIERGIRTTKQRHGFRKPFHLPQEIPPEVFSRRLP